ncbi:MAG TPA: YfbU family protein [Nitrosospira sp.]|nr:YfbU family protein [Nitrosospira sp.]
MKLSDGEKLILFMLGEIYEKLGIDGDIDPRFVAKAIRTGHLWAIKRKYYGIYDGLTNNDADIVRDVVRLLVMWDVMEAAYDRLTEAEKDELKRQTGLSAVTFGGFDANTEEQYYSVLMFLIYEMDEFSTFKGRELNAGHPMLESYMRMLAVFRTLGRMLSGRSFNALELIQILNARRASD